MAAELACWNSGTVEYPGSSKLGLFRMIAHAPKLGLFGAIAPRPPGPGPGCPVPPSCELGLFFYTPLATNHP